MKNLLRILAVMLCVTLPAALFAAASVDITVSAGETVQIELWGTGDSSVQLVNIATNQVVAAGGMLTRASGSYTNNYWGSGSGYIPGVSFTIGSYSYITGLPAGNYRLEVSTPGCTGWSSGYNPYYLSDWGTWDTMDYTVTVY